MLRRVNFWQEEHEAPLLRFNCNFLPCEKILEPIPATQENESPTNVDHERIIRLDAERTFLGSGQRTTLMNVLSFLRQEFKSYHQAMSYVAGFLLLTHTSSKVIETMRQLHQTVLVGYWTDEPIAFAIDAYVFDALLSEHDPEIHKHLLHNCILPETYVQKWFTTLCVGVLPFEALFLFFDTFIAESILKSSNTFLFQFALSLTKHIREGILKTKSAAIIYGYLRLDPSLPSLAVEYKHLAMSAVQLAKDFDLSQYDFKLLRKKAFDEKLRARLEAANRVHQKNQDDRTCSVTSSDDEENNDEAQSTTVDLLVSQMTQMRIE
jgi:hypothetical protein